MVPAWAVGTVIYSDDFSSGTGSQAGSGAIANGWESAGPETKEYNVASSGTLEWSETGAGFFDSVATGFTSASLVSVGDFISVSFDYSTAQPASANSGTGLRLRLYQQGADLFTGGSGYGINAPSGTSTGALSFRSYTSGNPYSTLTGEGNAIGSGTSYGDGGSVIFTATLTAPGQVTLSGSHSAAGAFNTSIASAALTTFDSVGISVGGVAHGLQLDNVVVTVIPEPSTLALLGLGVVGMLARRRRRA